MLRIKRSIQAQFNTQVNFMSAQMLAAASGYTTDSTPSGMAESKYSGMSIIQTSNNQISIIQQPDAHL